jgi:hypothetical protein
MVVQLYHARIKLARPDDFDPVITRILHEPLDADLREAILAYLSTPRFVAL